MVGDKVSIVCSLLQLLKNIGVCVYSCIHLAHELCPNQEISGQSKNVVVFLFFSMFFVLFLLQTKWDLVPEGCYFTILFHYISTILAFFYLLSTSEGIFPKQMA